MSTAKRSPLLPDVPAVAESYPGFELTTDFILLAPGGTLAFAWWDGPERQRLQALFREAVAEIGPPHPPEVPVHSTLQFCDAAEFGRLLEGAGLVDVEVRGHTAEYHVRDMEALC